MRNIASMSNLSCLCLALLLNQGFAHIVQSTKDYHPARKLQQEQYQQSDSDNWNQWSYQWGQFRNGFNPENQWNQPPWTRWTGGNQWNQPPWTKWVSPIPAGCNVVSSPNSYSYVCPGDDNSSGGHKTSPPSPSGSKSSPPFHSFAPPGFFPPGCKGVYDPGNPYSYSYHCNGDDNSSGGHNSSPPSPSGPKGQSPAPVLPPGFNHLPQWLQDWLKEFHDWLLDPSKPFPRPPFVLPPPHPSTHPVSDQQPVGQKA